MTAKFNLYIGTAALCSMALFNSCDNIDDNDRFIPVERPKIERVVLIEEFSGQNCVNCPKAADAIHDILKIYPESVVAVCFQPKDVEYTMNVGGLTTDLAKEYYEYYKPNAFPAALINGGTITNNYDTWATDIISAFAVPAPATLNATTLFDEETMELKVNYEVVFNQMYSGPLNIVLWLTESNIVTVQTMPDGSRDRNYVHNHILRTALNGTWGESIGSSFVTEQVVEGSVTFTLDSKWKPENCEVVGCLMQPGSKAVEQACSAPVIPSADEPDDDPEE